MEDSANGSRSLPGADFVVGDVESLVSAARKLVENGNK
jgi:hypothetical protein